MGLERTAIVALGAFGALLACAQSGPPRAPLAEAPPNAGAGSHALDPSQVEAGMPSPLDASSFPAAMDAAQGPQSDGAIEVPDARGLVGEVDARVPFLGLATLEVLTKPSPMSRYQPRNLLAVWIEHPAGTPIKVLARWAGVSQRGLTIFNMRAPSAFATGFFPQPDAGNIAEVDPDVITGATLRAHELHVLTWDLTDYAGTPVPDGTYLIFIETNDGTGDSGLAVLELVKGPEPSTLEQGESERFAHIFLSYTPRDP